MHDWERSWESGEFVIFVFADCLTQKQMSALRPSSRVASHEHVFQPVIDCFSFLSVLLKLINIGSNFRSQPTANQWSLWITKKQSCSSWELALQQDTDSNCIWPNQHACLQLVFSLAADGRRWVCISTVSLILCVANASAATFVHNSCAVLSKHHFLLWKPTKCTAHQMVWLPDCSACVFGKISQLCEKC